MRPAEGSLAAARPRGVLGLRGRFERRPRRLSFVALAAASLALWRRRARDCPDTSHGRHDPDRCRRGRLPWPARSTAAYAKLSVLDEAYNQAQTAGVGAEDVDLGRERRHRRSKQQLASRRLPPAHRRHRRLRHRRLRRVIGLPQRQPAAAADAAGLPVGRLGQPDVAVANVQSAITSSRCTRSLPSGRRQRNRHAASDRRRT